MPRDRCGQRRTNLNCAAGPAVPPPCAAPPEMLQRLRQLGMFRRSDDVELDVLTELIRQKASQLRCGHAGSGA